MTDTFETGEDESGRYRPGRKPAGEDVLFGIILDVLEEACSTQDPEILDSWAISSYERAIEADAEAGFAEIIDGDRITARLLPKARQFRDWLESYEQRERPA
jgi:hypothetical protein